MPEEGRPPVRQLRALLILTCTSVSFSHGTNSGQKSIGLIMLTIIGLLPASHALNPQATDPLTQLSQHATQAMGERLGKQHMTPGQGASAELIGSALIGTAGFTGLPVSTTHIGPLASRGRWSQAGRACKAIC